METVLRRPAVMWNVVSTVARTNERVAGIGAPITPPGSGNNPLLISAYYVTAIFGISCIAKANAAISAVRIYGSLDVARWPDPGAASEALVVVNADLAQGSSVIRYPVGSGAAGVDLSPRLLPPVLMLEYTVTGTAGMNVQLQVRAVFIGTPPFGVETADFAD
jgi:hypothetical protein